MDKLWINNQKQVFDLLYEMARDKSRNSQMPLTYVMSCIGKARELVISGSFDSLEWVNLWMTVGESMLEEMPNMKAHEFANMLLQKHRRYGVKSLSSWGQVGMLMRVNSKLDRWEHLLKSPDDCGDETIEDTKMDMLGYCVLGIELAKRS